jgi:hypothetical protein
MKWLALWSGLIKCTISAINGQQGAGRFGSLVSMAAIGQERPVVDDEQHATHLLENYFEK